MDFAPKSKVEEGAAVKLGGRFFVIAVSTGNFVCDGNEIMGISTQAPIYAELEGERVGDAISFNGTELVIEEVARQLRDQRSKAAPRHSARRSSRTCVECMARPGRSSQSFPDLDSRTLKHRPWTGGRRYANPFPWRRASGMETITTRHF
jgi:hypothetical protein